MVQAIYSFLSGSSRRWTVLKNHLRKKIFPKPLSATIDALFEISQDISYDPSSRHEAELLAQKMKNFKFCCCTVIRFNTLNQAFEKVISDSELTAAELDLEPSFSFEVSIKPRFKKQMLSYETLDDPIINPKDGFKIECFNCILDSAINSIEERFNQVNEHCDAFQFLNDIASIKKDFSKESLF
ncbi:uncharacterized protein LOC136088055 [Hydra vulgaris]|uniref:Uncharacterized protein LOC136088055 n=1 Tax=Hydra vulgaris TaxID=6087 RepID=A0ABM4D0K9_HYDVU